MTIAAPGPLASDFHRISIRLRSLLDSLFPCAAEISGQPRVVTHAQMATLLSCLMQAGTWLRTLPSEQESSLKHAVAEYREQVQRLHGYLPSIQSAILAERARLEQERERVRLAEEWMRTSRQTL